MRKELEILMSALGIDEKEVAKMAEETPEQREQRILKMMQDPEAIEREAQRILAKEASKFDQGQQRRARLYREDSARRFKQARAKKKGLVGERGVPISAAIPPQPAEAMCDDSELRSYSLTGGSGLIDDGPGSYTYSSSHAGEPMAFNTCFYAGSETAGATLDGMGAQPGDLLGILESNSVKDGGWEMGEAEAQSFVNLRGVQQPSKGGISRSAIGSLFAAAAAGPPAHELDKLLIPVDWAMSSPAKELDTLLM